jgi:hypothetical protein
MHSPANPLARARCVEAPAIAEVLDRETGEFHDVTTWVGGHLYQDLIAGRVELVERMQANDPRYLCSACYVPVYLVSRPEDRVFFFRHIREDGSCPARTRSALSAEEITARKYHGLRESKPHRDIKAMIERSLHADPAFRDIIAEGTWKSQADPKRYRRPDVQATAGGQRYAFEVQLSTTFLSVVAGRRLFYRDESALLVWIFGSFDPDFRRLTTDDLLFSNNSNIFVVDMITTGLSEATGRFHLRCHYREPTIEHGQLVDRWADRLVTLDDLHADLAGQRLFAVDYAGEAARLRAELAAAEQRQVAFQLSLDRQDLFEFWLVHGAGFRHTAANRETWAALRARFAVHGVELPLWPDLDGGIRAMLNAFYSLRENKPIGWHFAKLIEVAHSVAENHPRLMTSFGFAMKHFDRSAVLNEQDLRGRWKSRLVGIKPALDARDPGFAPEPTTLPLMRVLFPEIAAKVDAFWARSAPAAAA